MFLKGIGLSLDDALLFWQGAFSKKVTQETFTKQYRYNIRHNYGKEGKRADYTPYSCSKIIMGSAPGHDEHHGCPFKYFDETHLTGALRKLRVAGTDINDIVDLARTSTTSSRAANSSRRRTAKDRRRGSRSVPWRRWVVKSVHSLQFNSIA